MNKRSDLRTQRWRTAVLAITASLVLTGAAAAQDKKADTNVAAGYSTLDLSIFAGWQWFQFGQGHNAAIHQFGPAASWGERLTEDVHKYISLEEGVQIGYNRLRLLPVGGTGFSSESAS